MAAKRFKRVVLLTNTTKPHNKFYRMLLVERAPGAYVVETTYGRLGSTGSTQVSGESSWANSNLLIEQTKKAKIRRSGYVMCTDQTAPKGQFFQVGRIKVGGPFGHDIERLLLFDSDQDRKEGSAPPLPPPTPGSEEDIPEDAIFKKKEDVKHFDEVRKKRKEKAIW